MRLRNSCFEQNGIGDLADTLFPVKHQKGFVFEKFRIKHWIRITGLFKGFFQEGMIGSEGNHKRVPAHDIIVELGLGMLLWRGVHDREIEFAGEKHFFEAH